MTSTKGSRLVDDQLVDEGRILSISCEKLSPETLRAVIEEYVTSRV
jgi:hypothetical protein